jgi:hypothetical protein
LKNVNQIPKKLHGYIYSQLDFFSKRKNWKRKLKIGNKINRKTNVIFWKLKNPKNGKIGGGIVF